MTTLQDAISPDSFACESMHDALNLCEKEEEVYMIGGAMVYQQALKFADKMYITRVHHAFEDADTFFPEINYDEWMEVERLGFPADEKHAYPYTFLTYVRKK